MNVLVKSIKVIWMQLWRWLDRVVSMLGGRTISTLAAALLVTLLSVVVSDYWLTSILQVNNTLQGVHSNINSLHQLKSNLYQAESAQRGYLFTQRQSYVKPFNMALKEARLHIDHIDARMRKQTPPERAVRELVFLKAISASLEAKAAEMQMALELSLSGEKNAALQVVNLDASVAEMDKFINHTDLLINTQFKQLKDLKKKRIKVIELSRISLVTGALIVVVLMVLVIKQLLAEIGIKNDLQTLLAHKNECYALQIQQQSKLLRSLALDYQADVERERQKLSRELHDELGSIFTATKMDIAWTIKKIHGISLIDKVSKNALIEKLQKTNQYVDQGIQYQRHIVQELHPAMLSTFGFWPAFTSLIEDAAARNRWTLTLNLPDQTTQLNETISLIVYRIVQETLNNANKYAKATTIDVHLMIDTDFLKLEITDNGVGMDLTNLASNTHGLSGMRHRVLAIGGHFEMVSAPNKGLLTRALIPLDTALS